MAKVALDSRYATASILTTEAGVRYLDWFGDRKFELADFADNVAYKVREGDSVFSVASYLYGKQRYYWVVCRANLIFDPFERLAAGRILSLPSAATFAAKIIRG